MIYQYKATNKDGKKITNFISAENKSKAIQLLQEKGYIVISIKEKAKPKWRIFKRSRRISLTEKMFFTKNLAAMITSGLTLSEAINILREQAESKNLRYVLTEVSTHIQGGQKLSQSLAKFPKVFSSVYTNMIQAGEESGNLEIVLKHLSIQIEKDHNLRRKIKSAFVYPIVILSLTAGLAVFLLIFILPKIAKIFSSFSMDLPLPTRMLIATSMFLQEKWYIALAVFIVSIIVTSWILKRKFLKPILSRLILKIPVIGKISKHINLARTFRVLSSLLKSGIPLVKALDITSETLSNTLFKDAINDACFKTGKGANLSELLLEHKKLFPILAARMIGVGEQTGNLPQSAEQLAKMHEEEVDDLTKNLSTLLEPILLVIMGIAVGGIAISMISPIYKLPSMLQQR